MFGKHIICHSIVETGITMRRHCGLKLEKGTVPETLQDQIQVEVTIHKEEGILWLAYWCAYGMTFICQAFAVIQEHFLIARSYSPKQGSHYLPIGNADYMVWWVKP